MEKDQYVCQYPRICTHVSKRPGELKRHYSTVHAAAEKFSYDYRECSRASFPFIRKDHYREHLQCFHKEDIGCARRNKDTKEWTNLQNTWLAERQVFSNHWRCTRCLTKNIVADVGWQCISCETRCEAGRIAAREALVGGGL